MRKLRVSGSRASLPAKPMLPSLRIRNFRMLQDFHVPQLGRVNLIVGKNNSGKSTILEALRVYADHALSGSLIEMLDQHDELIGIQTATTGDEDEAFPYQNFFTGRRFPRGEGAIYVGDEEERDFVRIAHTYFVEKSTDEGTGKVTVTQRVPISAEQAAEEAQAERALLVSSSRQSRPLWIHLDSRFKFIRQAHIELPSLLPVGYVPPGVLPPSALSDHWDRSLMSNFDQMICEGLRIVEPKVERLNFVKRNGSSRGDNRERVPIVKLSDMDRPIPLGSMGDGMMRILQLLLLLAPARRGFYLVDEFENGLHYSVQERVWQMIFTLARANDVQVFATTHSWDCIEAFRNVAMQTGDPALLFRVGRSVKTSDRGRIIATRFEKEALAALTQMDVEVR